MLNLGRRRRAGRRRRGPALGRGGRGRRGVRRRRGAPGRLAARLRGALPARFAVTVHYYLAAGVALLTGIPAGAWMMVVDDDARPRLLLFHAHVNLLGWVTLTVLGTLLTLWPTVLRTRMVDGAAAAARTALPVAVAGLASLAVGVLAWWPVLAVGGLALFAVAVRWSSAAGVRDRPAKPAGLVRGLVDRGRRLAGCSSPSAVDAWSLLAAADPAAAAANVRRGPRPADRRVRGAGRCSARWRTCCPSCSAAARPRCGHRTAALDRHWPQRVAMANAALAVFLLPVPPYVRIAASLLVLAALLQFLVPAARVLLAAEVAVSTLPDPRPAVPPASRRFGRSAVSPPDSRWSCSPSSRRGRPARRRRRYRCRRRPRWPPPGTPPRSRSPPRTCGSTRTASPCRPATGSSSS